MIKSGIGFGDHYLNFFQVFAGHEIANFSKNLHAFIVMLELQDKWSSYTRGLMVWDICFHFDGLGHLFSF